ncbi:hypothetical protein CCY99_09285, partial [Helicobacter sp. 16-1353]|uniref:hypothetical protein n=1 Tax=Helicobacter sp. 16-1353 TaxID=2004996 RepID=UPI000DCB7F8E
NLDSKPTFLSETLENFYYPTHYEIALLVAKILGYEIINPNQKENIFYINGLDIAGNGEYLEVRKSKNKLEFLRKY